MAYYGGPAKKLVGKALLDYIQANPATDVTIAKSGGLDFNKIKEQAVNQRIAEENQKRGFFGNIAYGLGKSLTALPRAVIAPVQTDVLDLDEQRRFKADPHSFGLQSLANTGSFFVPGVGQAGSLFKIASQGALAGALQGFGNQDLRKGLDIGEVAKSALIGGGVAGGLGLAGKALSRARTNRLSKTTQPRIEELVQKSTVRRPVELPAKAPAQRGFLGKSLSEKTMAKPLDNVDDYIRIGFDKNPTLRTTVERQLGEEGLNLNSIFGGGKLNTAQQKYVNELKDWVKGAIGAREREGLRKAASDEATRAVTRPTATPEGLVKPTSTQSANVNTVFDSLTANDLAKGGIKPRIIEARAILDDYRRAGITIGEGQNMDRFLQGINSVEKYRVANKLPRSSEGILSAMKIAGEDLGSLRKVASAAGGKTNINDILDQVAEKMPNYGTTPLDIKGQLRKDIRLAYPEVMNNKALITAEEIAKVQEQLRPTVQAFNQSTGAERITLMQDPKIMARVNLYSLLSGEEERILGATSGGGLAKSAYATVKGNEEGLKRIFNKIDPQTQMPVTRFQAARVIGNTLGSGSNKAQEFIGRILRKTGERRSTPGVFQKSVGNMVGTSFGERLSSAFNSPIIQRGISLGVLNVKNDPVLAQTIGEVDQNLGPSTGGDNYREIEALINETVGLDVGAPKRVSRQEFLNQALNMTGGNIQRAIPLAEYLAKDQEDQVKEYQRTNKPLSATERKALAQATFGLRGISALNDIISQAGSAGGLAFNASLPDFLRTPEGRQFQLAAQQVKEALGRLQSGANITKTELELYSSLIPSTFDDPETTAKKLEEIANFFFEILPQRGSE